MYSIKYLLFRVLYELLRHFVCSDGGHSTERFSEVRVDGRADNVGDSLKLSRGGDVAPLDAHVDDGGGNDDGDEHGQGVRDQHGDRQYARQAATEGS